MDYVWWNWDRTWLSPSDKIRVLSPILQPKYAEYKPKTLIASRDEMRVLEVDVQFIPTDYGLQKWISPTQDIRQLTFVLELLCEEYRPRIWFAKNEGIQPLTVEIQRICAEYRNETWLSPSDEFRVLYTAYNINWPSIGPKYEAPSYEFRVLALNMYYVNGISSPFHTGYNKCMYWCSR